MELGLRRLEKECTTMTVMKVGGFTSAASIIGPGRGQRDWRNADDYPSPISFPR
jgi:hypothetical protein